MKNDEKIKTQKKPFQRKYILTAGSILLVIIIALFFSFLQEPKPDPDSEYKIRMIVSEQLNKDPNALTDEDFAKITDLPGNNFSSGYSGGGIRLTELSDIILLRKFTNLQVLDFGILMYSRNKIPKWMTILSKFSDFDPYERLYIDLEPLEKLYSLEQIYLRGSIKNIKPLENLTNLQTLEISSLKVEDIKPLSKLTNIKSLILRSTKVSDLSPLLNLTKLTSLSIIESPVSDLTPIVKLENLQTINFYKIQVRDIQPLANLVNLRRLSLQGSQISNLEPLKELKHLKRIDIRELPITDLEPLKNLNELRELIIKDCNNITDEQIDDLQKALPDLKIDR